MNESICPTGCEIAPSKEPNLLEKLEANKIRLSQELTAIDKSIEYLKSNPEFSVFLNSLNDCRMRW